MVRKHVPTHANGCLFQKNCRRRELLSSGTVDLDNGELPSVKTPGVLLVEKEKICSPSECIHLETATCNKTQFVEKNCHTF